MKKTLRSLLSALLLASAAVSAALAELPSEVWLGPAPVFPYTRLEIPALRGAGQPQPIVDTQNRGAVADFFDSNYTPALSVPINWTGNTANCVAGTTSQAYLDATIQMVNYFRAMAGLPDVGNAVSVNDESQEAALMMFAQGALSHDPDPPWACYSVAGHTGAANSNLALGTTGPGAILAYIWDFGGGNEPVGHRRWILYPRQAAMGTGSNNGANSLYVFAPFTSRPASPTAVTWPPAGFVPYQVVYPRWSLSLNSSPGADYGDATVTMTENGANIPLTIVNNSFQNFGDQTIVWEPSGLFFPSGQQDRTIEVTVANIVNGTPSSVTYEVTVIDPAITPDEIFADGFESGNTTKWSSKVP